MTSILSIETRDDSWAKFLKAQVRLDDGAVVSRQIEDHGAAAAVLPYDPQRRVAVLVRLLRVPALYHGGDGQVTEPVAGIIDPGEDAETAARREAWEEAGLRLERLEAVGEVWTTPGISTERMSLFLAPFGEEDRVGVGGGADGENENITVLEVPLAELDARLAAGSLGDLKLLALVQALKLRRPELFA